MTLNLYFDRFANDEGIYHIYGYDCNNLVMDITCDGYEINDDAVLLKTIGHITSIIGYIKRSAVDAMFLDDDGELEEIFGEYKTE